MNVAEILDAGLRAASDDVLAAGMRQLDDGALAELVRESDDARRLLVSALTVDVTPPTKRPAREQPPRPQPAPPARPSGGAKKRPPPQRILDDVLKEIRLHPRSGGQLATDMDAPKTRIYRALVELRDQGLLEMTRDGRRVEWRPIASPTA